MKGKPPLQPNNSELNKLLTTIQEKETIVQQLELKLQEQAPQEIVKEVESGKVIQSLQRKLVNKEQPIKQIHFIYLLLLELSTLAIVSWVRLLVKKGKKNK